MTSEQGFLGLLVLKIVFRAENRSRSKRGNPLSLIMGTALAKSRSARGVSHQPGFILERSSEKFQRL